MAMKLSYKNCCFNFSSAKRFIIKKYKTHSNDVFNSLQASAVHFFPTLCSKNECKQWLRAQFTRALYWGCSCICAAYANIFRCLYALSSEPTANTCHKKNLYIWDKGTLLHSSLTQVMYREFAIQHYVNPFHIPILIRLSYLSISTVFAWKFSSQDYTYLFTCHYIIDIIVELETHCKKYTIGKES